MPLSVYINPNDAKRLSMVYGNNDFHRITTCASLGPLSLELRQYSSRTRTDQLTVTGVLDGGARSDHTAGLSKLLQFVNVCSLAKEWGWNLLVCCWLLVVSRRDIGTDLNKHTHTRTHARTHARTHTHTSILTIQSI